MYNPRMAAIEDQPRSPVIANLVVILGFVSVFTTFATDSAFSWIIGTILIVSGGIWAGFVGEGAPADAHEGQGHGGVA